MKPKRIIRLHESLPLPCCPRVWAEVSREALAHNWQDLCAHIRRCCPRTEAMAVVKADAYGHGILPVVGTLLDVGCRMFAFACMEEAIAAREIIRETLPDSDCTLLVLGYTPPVDAAILAEYAITTAILSEDYAQALSDAATRAGVTVTCHIAVDTGMNRIGIPAYDEKDAPAVAGIIRDVCNLPGLDVTGVFSHPARADEDLAAVMAEHSRTMCQYRRFRTVRKAVKSLHLHGKPLLFHLCNSAAAVRFPDAVPEGCMDAVRLGISLYGYGMDLPDGTPISNRPVMRLMTTVVHIHTLPVGESLGYGGTYTADTPRTIATLPVGYADGLLRALSGAYVTVHTAKGNIKAPIVGRICMDQCMIDVTDLDVRVNDRVTIFGQTPDELLALSRQADTIPYELLCLLTARVPRIIM